LYQKSFPKKAYQNLRFFHLSYDRIASIITTVFVPKVGLPGLYQKSVHTTSTVFTVAQSHGLPIMIFLILWSSCRTTPWSSHHDFFILWSSYACRIIRIFWLVMNFLELHPESVFRFGIGRYFFGIWLTDTGGKLGKDFSMPVYCIYVLFHGSLHSCVLYLRICSAVVDTISWCNTIPNIPTDKGR
jgi:hypothetical protein